MQNQTKDLLGLSFQQCYDYKIHFRMLCLFFTRNALFVVHEKAGDGELSLSVHPGVVNRLPNKEKIAVW